MSDREKTSSGIGLDIIANQNKVKKSSRDFGANSNISLDLNDTDPHVEDMSMADNDFLGSSRLDEKKIDELERLNNYHSTYETSSTKKESPLFKSNSRHSGSGNSRHNSRHNSSSHSLDPITEKVTMGGSSDHERHDSNRDKDRYGKYDDYDNYSLDGGHGGGHSSYKTEAEILREKQELYYKLQALREKGVRMPKHFTEQSDLDDMTFHYTKITENLKRRKGVKTLRNVLTTAASVVEFANEKFNPFNFKLEGWSESMNENITDFDEVFEELCDKYFRDRSSWPPEIRLIFLFIFSAVTFHMTNQFTANIMQNGGSFMGMNMGDMANVFNKSKAKHEAQQPQQRGAAVQETMRRPNMQFKEGAPTMNVPRGNRQQPLREMRAPQGVDDIIADLQTELGEMDDDTTRGGGGGGGGDDDSDDFSILSDTGRNMKNRSKKKRVNVSRTF
jgi:hypothetical protein